MVQKRVSGESLNTLTIDFGLNSPLSVIALFSMLLLTPCKQKMVNYVLHKQPLNFLKKSDFNQFWN